MTSVSASTSPSTDSMRLRAASDAHTDQPVCGGSMKTRSKCASQVSALSSEVPADRPVAVELFGVHWVLARPGGSLVAFIDECPHRLLQG